MNRAMLIQLTIGLVLGGGLGAVMGYFGKCTSGACPLTANPWRGAFIGALLGGLFALSAGSRQAAAETPGTQHAVLQIGSAAEFEQRVLKADKPVLVDFYAAWCGPCRNLAPTIEKIARQYEGRALVYKVNVDRLSPLAGRYGVENIPAVLFFRDGKEVQRLIGVQPAGAYARVLDRLAGHGS
jgi:thioredoxin 1